MKVSDLKNKSVIYAVGHHPFVFECVVYKTNAEFVYVKPVLPDSNTYRIRKEWAGKPQELPCWPTDKLNGQQHSYGVKFFNRKADADLLVLCTRNRKRLGIVITDAFNAQKRIRDEELDFDPALLQNLDDAVSAVFAKLYAREAKRV